MRLAFTSKDLSNTTIINKANGRPLYEVISSPELSNERFTTLRHSPPEGKERSQGKYVGSIEWGEGLLDDDDREEDDREEGWFVWANPEAPKAELSTLLRPVEGKGRLARIFTGHMRAEYLWSFKSRLLPGKSPHLQLTPLISPDPMVTYYPPTTARTPSSSGTPNHNSRRSFSLSRTASRPASASHHSTSHPHSPEEPATPAEPDAPFGYLDISPRAVEMLDLVVLTFLVMVLSPQTASLQRSFSSRLSSHHSPATVLAKKSSSKSLRGRSAGSSHLPSAEQTEPISSGPDTPSDTDSIENAEAVRGRPVPPYDVARRTGGWKDVFTNFRTPSPASFTSGLGAGMDKIRRFSFPALVKPKVNVESS